MKDDPGRQEIGSFNPITETDWTGMKRDQRQLLDKTDTL
jgi:hypothetical protein